MTTNNTTWIKGRIRLDDDRDDTAVNTVGGGLDEAIANVTVQLINKNGHVVATTKTGHDGKYQFDVPAGTYAVRVPELDGLELADKGVGHRANLDSDINPDTGRSDFFHADKGETTTLDVSYKPDRDDDDDDDDDDNDGGNTQAWIKGRISFDDDKDDTELNTEGNGKFDGGLDGRVVLLRDKDGKEVARDTTNHNGDYQFDVPAGTYFVDFPDVNGLVFARKDVGDIRFDSDADENGNSDLFTIKDGQTFKEIDASYQHAADQVGWIKGRISFDDDKDDTEINTEGGADFDSGLGGRVVILRNADGTEAARTTTNDNGEYQFDVPSGRYFVDFPDVNGLVFADADVGDPRFDSDANPDGNSDVFDIAGGQTIMDLDASYQHAAPQVAWIKGRLSLDDDNDDTEVNTVGGGLDEGIAGREIVLRDAATGDVVGRTTTDANGMYQFDVPGGTYFVDFPEIDGLAFATQNVGPEETDSDSDQNGNSEVFTVAAGDTVMDLDVSYQDATGMLMGRVTFDDDNDNTEVNSVGGGLDEGLEGITVELLDTDGNVVDTTTTDDTGKYKFTVDAGTYAVRFPEIDGLRLADTGVGPEDVDSDANATFVTDAVVVNAGETTNDVDVSYQFNDVDAVDDTGFMTNQGVAAQFDVLNNDTDAQGDGFRVTDVTDGANGTGQILDNGNVAYFPNPGFSGEDTFTYTITDDLGATDTATVTITVKPENSTDAIDDDSTGDFGETQVIDVLKNDTDPEDDAQTIIETTDGANGTVEIVNGKVEYTPNDGFSGEDTFTYTIQDENGATDTATVTVVVGPENTTDARNDESNGDFGETQVIDVLANDTDAEGDDQTIIEATDGANGTVAIVDGKVEYTPNDGFSGQDTFTYTIQDENGATDTASVTVNVGDQPIAIIAGNLSNDVDFDDTEAGNIFGFENQTVRLLDENGNVLQETTTGPLGEYSFTTVEGNYIVEFPEIDGFIFADKDVGGDPTVDSDPIPGNDGRTNVFFATGTVQANIDASYQFNDVDAVDDAQDVDRNTPTEIDVLANDTDDQGDAFTVTDVTDGANGTVVILDNGNVQYTPDDGFVGEDTFTYTITDDNGATDTATVTVNVGGDNATDAVDDTSTGEFGEMQVIDVLANDSDAEGDDQTITAVTQGANGTVAIVDGQVTYTPNAGFAGEDTFTYTITDEDGATD
ncbi:MAG: Ig-like domain-containing protein, partial [Pseudomonadota bacterium]